MKTHFLRRGPHWIIVVALAMVSTSCFDSPDRLNPIDPGSIVYNNTGELYVVVENYRSNRLSHAWVRIESLGLAQQTDPDGIAMFKIPAGSYLISAELDGFKTTVVADTVIARESEQTVITLNGLPAIENASMYTMMNELTNGRHEYWYRLRVDLKDPDTVSDLYDLEILQPDSETLSPTFSRNEEEVQLVYEYPLRWDTLQVFTQLLYEPFRLSIRDTKEDADTVWTEMSSFLNYPLLSSDMIPNTNFPKNSVNFQWYNPQGDQSSNGSEIYFEPRKWEIRIREGVNTDYFFDTTFVFTDSLTDTLECLIDREGMFTPSVIYYWELSLYDDYGNVARSLDRLFRVINDGGL